MGNTNANTDANANMDANTNHNAVGNQAAATMPGYVLSGTRGGAVRLTLPKGSYTIDGDGNLIIHGGGNLSGGEAGGMSSFASQSLSYEEFMKKPDGNSAESRTGGSRDPFGMDFSALGTDPEKLVGECRGTVYGYVRCSTLHQDYQRQIDALARLGIREENIFRDKKSGKDFNREEFQKLMDTLQPGDCLVVVELDRFGRNVTEIKKHWFWITQHKQADIVVLDQPVLNTRIGAHGLGAFLADLILAVFSLMAEIERNLINKRMEDGIRLARLAGKKLGRKLMAIPIMFWKFKDMFLSGKISQNKASQRLGVDPKTFRSWMERTEGISDAQEWEELKAWIEEREREERIRQAKIEYGETIESAVVEKEQEASAVQGAEEARGMMAAQETETAQEMMATQEMMAARETATAQEVEVGQGAEAVQRAEMGRKTNAGRNGAAAGQDVPAESGRADADDGKGHIRQTVENSMKQRRRLTMGRSGVLLGQMADPWKRQAGSPKIQTSEFIWRGKEKNGPEPEGAPEKPSEIRK